MRLPCTRAGLEELKSELAHFDVSGGIPGHVAYLTLCVFRLQLNSGFAVIPMGLNRKAPRATPMPSWHQLQFLSVENLTSLCPLGAFTAHLHHLFTLFTLA